MFENEYKDLLSDIDFSNIKLEEEHNTSMKIEEESKIFKKQRENDEEEEPTLNELRKISAKLEDTYLNKNATKHYMREPPSNKGRKNVSSGRTKLASLALKKKNNAILANNNDSYQNISQHDEDSDYKPTKRSSKSSRLRKRLQAAKEEDQDAKYFI